MTNWNYVRLGKNQKIGIYDKHGNLVLEEIIGTNGLPIGIAGNSNTNNLGFGTNALSSNTTGSDNTANGVSALYNNTTGSDNTANGYQSLYYNTTGNYNTANGLRALYNNTTGSGNTANGYQALYTYNNTASAAGLLVAIGYEAGYNYTGAETGNIVIGGNVLGTAGESNVIRIGSTFTRNDLIKSNGWLANYGHASDTELTTTAATVVASFTPFAQANFMVGVYFRVVTAATTVTLSITYTDGSGAQTITIVNAVSEAVGSYNFAPIYINATTASAISVSATAGTANQVFVSSDIVAV